MRHLPFHALCALWLIVCGCPTDGDDDTADDDTGDDDTADDDAADDDTADDDTADDDIGDDDFAPGNEPFEGGPDAVIIGSFHQLLGTSLSRAGDTDGDGVDDVLLGGPHHDDEETGKAYLFRGPFSGTLPASAADAVLVGPSETGASVAGGEDVDGDGFDDLLVGSPDIAGSYAYLVLGPVSGTVDLTLSADATLEGATWEDAGASVAMPGDVDGDGYADLVVAAPNLAGFDVGRAYFLRGPVSGTISLLEADAILYAEWIHELPGMVVSAAGDTDDDGRSEFLVSAVDQNFERGEVYLFRHPVEGLSSVDDAYAVLTGGQTHEFAGSFLSNAGDMNHDGNADFLISAPGNDAGGSDAGVVYLVNGPVSGAVDLAQADTTLTGTLSDGTWFGSVPAGVGDINGDGWGDVVVGEPAEDGASAVELGGTVRFFRGPLPPTLDYDDASAIFRGPTDHGVAGCAVSPAGDIDDDGFDDLLIGARGDDEGGNLAGKVYLFRGSAF